MERKLSLILISVVAAALGLGGCGDDAASIERTPAGEACAAGGVRIGEGDEAFFICDSPITEEAPGENCPEGGLRVQIGEGVRYLCSSAIDPDPEGDEDRLRIEALPLAEAFAHCGSEAIRIIQPGADEEEQILCVKTQPKHEPLVRVVDAWDKIRDHFQLRRPCRWPPNSYYKEGFARLKDDIELTHAYSVKHASCASAILNELGFPPEGSLVGHHFECARRRSEDTRDCYTYFVATHDEGICEIMSARNAFYTCLEASEVDREAFCADVPEPTSEGTEWDSDAQELADLLACDLRIMRVY